MHSLSYIHVHVPLKKHTFYNQQTIVMTLYIRGLLEKYERERERERGGEGNRAVASAW